MCVTQFRRLCNKSRFYYFKSYEDFEKRIDWEGKKINKNIFLEDLKFDKNLLPTQYTAYGTLRDKEYYQLIDCYE